MKALSLAAASLAAAFLAVASPAVAQVPMVGRFVAEATCPATPSIREIENNPGAVTTAAGETYALVGRNAVPGSHYLILVPGAEPERRWVAYGCGRIEEEGTQVGAAPGVGAAPDRATSDRYVLAASWQPAFCETRPRVAECRDGGRDDRGFALHGLWPQPRGREYCGVDAAIVARDEDGDWRRLPEFEASADTRRRLAAVMPGVASGLDRHEWIKHGTCFPGDADGYFALSVRLVEELNESAVRDLFEAAIGESLSAAEIRASFDAAFGAGAGGRVLVDCAEAEGRRLIRELRIELEGIATASFAELVRAGARVQPGCRAGEVDAAGF